MGFTDKLPLLKSKHKTIKVVGYVLYAFIILMVIGAIFGSDEESTHASTSATDKEPEVTDKEPEVSDKEPEPSSVPFRTGAIVDDWGLVISRFNPSATRVIMEENMFNDEPSAGGQYVMVYFNAKNLGDTKRSFSTSKLHLEGASGMVYDTEFFPPIVPNAFEREAFPGAFAEGNIVFDIATQDANSLKLYYSSWGSGKTYFDLR